MDLNLVEAIFKGHKLVKTKSEAKHKNRIRRPTTQKIATFTIFEMLYFYFPVLFSYHLLHLDKTINWMHADV